MNKQQPFQLINNGAAWDGMLKIFGLEGRFTWHCNCETNIVDSGKWLFRDPTIQDVLYFIGTYKGRFPGLCKCMVPKEIRKAKQILHHVNRMEAKETL